MESKLRKDCQTLLRQLQTSQQLLNNEIDGHLKLGQTVSEKINFLDDDGNSLSKSAYARNKLLNTVKYLSEGDDKMTVTGSCRNDLIKNKENIDYKNTEGATLQENTEDIYGPTKPSSHLDDRVNLMSVPQTKQTESYKKHSTVNDDNDAVISSSWQPATPNTQHRRNIIDRHTHVPTKLNADELIDLNKERRLNFSYSQVNPDDDDDDIIPHLSSENNPGNPSCNKLKGRGKVGKTSEQASLHSISSRCHANDTDGEYHHQTQSKTSDKFKHCANNLQHTFKVHLEDDGNNRKLNNFIRDTTIKPKSLLNSSTYSLHNLNASRKNSSGVRFDTSRNTQESFPDQRLLGYDWIAALLDNESEQMNQSESFFNELREFRKAYKDECSNQFYMEGPHTLVDFEPEPVAEVLRDPKVQPYIVNERLFTEALQSGLINYENEDSPTNKGSKKKPTADNPRFVRVSIPRSTLQTPHRMKPHRRRSFDSSNSCSLMDHCLLGWENALPSMIPTAKSLDLHTAAGTRSDYQTTTLAEAERLALTSSHAQWPFEKPNPRLQLFPLWKKHYMDSASNMSIPAASSTNSSISRTLDGETIKRSTDKLLNSAYLTMYEMERLKEERRLESLMRGREKIK